MPYIKKIEINGFKTFGLKTTLLLDKGFTVVTGPNGSGKTNIIDAVLFGLGELSAKRLRAENFSNLIFHGGSNQNVKKKNDAKVVVQFDNMDNRIPIETVTVTVSREINHSGESVYRINGRRVPRSHFMEIFSMAGISPYGHNIILQGTLTRVAEISSHERRKIIEDMIGIAQYDAEKAEAEEKLKSAEIAIKTALGQVGEVQKRVEDLERERNDLLRYNFIKNEITHLEAIKISQEIKNTENKVSQLSSEIKKLEEKLGKLRENREYLRTRRRETETEWRKLGFEAVEEGQTRIMEVQIKIGELRSRLSELSTKINAGKPSLDGLNRVRENTSRQTESIEKEVEDSKVRIKQLIMERDLLAKEIEEKQSVLDSISSEAAQVRLKLGENDEKIREFEEHLGKLSHDAVSLRSEYAESQSRISVYSQRLVDLEAKRDDLKSSLERLQESLKGLKDIQNEQKEQLKTLQRTLEKRAKQRELTEKEMKEAEKIAETAREALVEFEAQKDIVDKVKTEENALKNIEELGTLGVISGIHGRLKNLIKIERGYERAVEAAAAGWLNSLVVQDLDVAFTCVETLKRLKLGRIKIIPLQGLSPANQVDPPKIDGIKDRVSTFVKYAEQYKLTISFILGDTFLAQDEKAALAASRAGFRSVTLNGDLYEAGGGVESGFYRSPVDLSSFVPSKSALKSLDQAVKALQGHLKNRENSIGEIEGEISEIQGEITRLSEALAKLESEIELVDKSIHQTGSNIKHAEKNIEDIQSLLEKEKVQVELYEKRQDAIAREEEEKRKELNELKKQTDLSKIQETEIQREALGNEIIALRQKNGSIETELSTLQSKMENVLKASLENATIQLSKVSKQIPLLEKEVEDAVKERDEVEEEIEELEKEKETLSRSLLNSREEAKKHTSQIDTIDSQLQQIEREYEQVDRLNNELRLNLQTLHLLLDKNKEQLKSLGYEEPLDVSPKQVQEAESTVKLMKLELERIGAVNQLAQTQYAEQISRYKELSIRMNELEKENKAIIDFIESIEQKKYKVFMEAFNQINQQLDKYFSKLTGGGNTALKLENPENPFAGGVDMIVQFLNKPPILVSGASSGERSVAAVAFLFALQEFTPASFYLFDEIDAHLDAFHVERLGDLLAEEAAKSQFLVVTLKPEMVSKAERIYGVYGRDGVSHIVSTTFKGAV